MIRVGEPTQKKEEKEQGMIASLCVLFPVLFWVTFPVPRLLSTSRSATSDLPLKYGTCCAASRHTASGRPPGPVSLSRSPLGNLPPLEKPPTIHKCIKPLRYLCHPRTLVTTARHQGPTRAMISMFFFIVCTHHSRCCASTIKLLYTAEYNRLFCEPSTT